MYFAGNLVYLIVLASVQSAVGTVQCCAQGEFYKFLAGVWSKHQLLSGWLMQKDYTAYVGSMFCWWNIEVMEGAKDRQVKGVSEGLSALYISYKLYFLKYSIVW